MLSTDFDWNTESLKGWKSESLKCRPIRKKKFSTFFLDQMEPKSEKKNKSENFEKFGQFLLPVLRNKAQGLTPSGIVLNELSSMQKMATRRWFQSWRVLSMVLLLGTTFHRPSGRADAGAPPL